MTQPAPTPSSSPASSTRLLSGWGGPRSVWSSVSHGGMALLILAGAAPGLAQAGSTTIIIRPPITRPPIVWPYPYPVPETNRVRVEFDAQGTDWGAVYLDGRLIYRPHNFDRQKTIYLSPGGYRLEITGVVRSDRWASGYLDLGRDDSHLAVIRFSKTGGVTVSGGPYVWIED